MTSTICPFCKEQIKNNAVVCKHCHKDLTQFREEEKGALKKAEEKKKEKTKQDNRRAAIFLVWLIVVVLSFWIWYITIPIVIAWIVWKKTKLDKNKKLLAILGCFVLFIVLTVFNSQLNSDPTISILEPENNYSVQAQTIPIKGSVDPVNSKLLINNAVIRIQPDGSFTYDGKLSNEQNVFTISATNRRGKSQTQLTVNRIFTEEEIAEREKAQALEAKKRKQEAVENKYLSEVTQISTDISNSLAYIGTLTSSKPLPVLWTDEELIRAAAATLIIESSYATAQELSVPNRFKEMHDLLLSALEKFSTAMPLFRNGVDNMNVNQIEQALLYIDAGSKLLQKATVMVNQLAK